MPTKKELQDQVAMLNDALSIALNASPEKDNNFYTGGLSDLYTSRSSWERKKIFAEALRAWRVNPIARRIVRLMTSFVVGKGFKFKSDSPEAEQFLTDWATHPENKIVKNAKRWKDEDTRTGNLFFLYNVMADGMTIIRAVPVELIDEIQTDPDDIEKELEYTREGLEQGWKAYDPNNRQDKFMLHFASNKPIGSAWGEGDLPPLLVWIGRFSSWLENRARLNQFRTTFMYVVEGAYKSELERATREKNLQANPPKTGSVLVTNSNAGEKWGTLSPNLDSFDASLDGQNLKKMILDGIGHPMHWHAEPEGATQTTADAAGTPTFRTLEETQDDFFEMLISMARIAIEIKGLNQPEKIWIEGQDITERDNASLALALGRAYPNLTDMLDRGAIDEKEFMRLTYKMFAEVWDGTTPTIKKKPLVEMPATQTDTENDPLDPKEQADE